MTMVRWWSKIKKPVPKKLLQYAYCETTVTDWRHYTICDLLPDNVIKAKNVLVNTVKEVKCHMNTSELLEDTNFTKLQEELSFRSLSIGESS